MTDGQLQYFAVIDTETNWYNEVMSVGIVIGDALGYGVKDKRYYVIHPECNAGGMYFDVLRAVDRAEITDCARTECIEDLVDLLSAYDIRDILAYNAPFDYKCLPELHKYVWRDILPVASNRRFNVKLPDNCEYFSTGLLRRGRGVENVMRLIYNRDYCELHNALQDAIDELLLVKLIDRPLCDYAEYKPKQAVVPKARRKTVVKSEENLLKMYRYVVDELCGGSVRLADFTRETRVEQGAEKTTVAYDDCLLLLCSRCGFKWTQNVEDFLKNHKCPKCG